ncbi:MAG TPA: L,D-transpeptidase [Ktedonobacteraceae bacterium]|nr:L,D-transpeptidase [Ktedonobacteraceae bacterium]
MQRVNRILCCSKLCALFLGLFLSFNTLAFPGNAYLQIAHAYNARSSGINASDAREMKASAFYGSLVKHMYGKVILVSLSQQWMYIYKNGQELLDTPVTTGRPQLPTPTGVYHIFRKLSPATFYSPWPKSSPYWYPPTRVQYALEWRWGGYFIHDAWWHTVYGPGTNGWHYDPTYGWEWGSHGCISVPLDVAAWLYNWAPDGTTVWIMH